MIWNIFEYVATLIEYIIYADFMIRFLDVKRSNNPKICYLIIITLNTSLTLTFNYFMSYEGILCLIRIFMNFILALFLLSGTYFEKIFTSMILDISALLISYSSLNLLAFLSGNTIEGIITERGLIRLLNLFITKALLFLITRVILRLKDKKSFRMERSEFLYIIMIFVLTFAIGLGIFRSNLDIGAPSDSPISISIGLGLIFVNVLTYILMKRISDKNAEKEKLLLDNAQNAIYRSQLSEYEKQYEEMRKIRHDMQNHLQCLSGLISQNDSDQAREYIEDILQNKLDFGCNYIKSGNKAVDVIINMKLLQCKKEKISTVVHINKFDTCVNSIDMCALLSNILDNAIEACRNESDEKEIQVEILPRKGYVNIVVKNSIARSILEQNPELLTTKEDKKIHGIGLKSVNDIVKKYDGMYEFFEKNNYFITNIWLPLKLPIVAE